MASKSRRSFLSNLGVAASAAGATLAAGVPVAHAQTPSDASVVSGFSRTTDDGRWQPARHDKDDWYDQLPGKHRLFFDTTKPEALEDAIQFAGNFYTANRGDYALEQADLAVIVCMRHRSAPFAFSDAIWAKYGATLAKRAEFVDPNSHDTPKVNPFHPVAPAAPARARGLAGLMTLGVQFAICNLSTHGIASMIAGVTGGTADAVYKELAANLIDKARLVPAGIVAVNRAQERGYSITGS
jgi:intracellular sulfur oxidation DsrE/DsrF family protein